MILKVALSNIRRRKSTAFTFMIMTLMSAFMSCIALSLFVGMNMFFDHKHEELKGAHYSSFIPGDVRSANRDNYLNASEYVKAWVSRSGFIQDGTVKNLNIQGTFIFLNEEDYLDSDILPLTYIHAMDSRPEGSIVVPYSFYNSGLRAGDTLELESNGKEDTYTIYAFFEDIEVGGSTMSVNKFFLQEDTLDDMEGNIAYNKVGHLSVIIDDPDHVNEFTKGLPMSEGEMSITYSQSKASSLSFVTIVSLIMLLFAALVIVIALVIVRFSVVTSMEEDIVILGSLKSIGFTSKQLISSQVIQYSLLALVGCILGVLLSVASFGPLGNVIASTSGMLWAGSTNWMLMILAVIGIMLLTSGCVYMLSRRVRKITPINAMRSGDSHHSFKKNRLPLSKYKLSVNVHLALKYMVSSVRTNAMLVLVLAVLCALSALGLIIQYNMVNPKAFYEMVGLEDADYGLVTFENSDPGMVEEIIRDERIDKLVYIANSKAIVDEHACVGRIYKNYEDSTAKDLYEGRRPDAENEIVLGSVVANEIGKEIGDTVKVDMNGKIQEYIVVGLAQGLGGSGQNVFFTEEGGLRHTDKVFYGETFLFLKKDVDKEAFLKEYQDKFGGQVFWIEVEKMMESIFGSMEQGIFMAAILIMIASVFVVAFILFLIISTLVRKEKKNYGIMKACGYTSKEIMTQILVSYAPAILVGSALGVSISTLFTNDMLSLMFMAAGLNKTFFVVPIFQNVIVGTGLFVAAMAIIWIVSMRIRQISVQKLIIQE